MFEREHKPLQSENKASEETQSKMCSRENAGLKRKPVGRCFKCALTAGTTIMAFLYLFPSWKNSEPSCTNCT